MKLHAGAVHVWRVDLDAVPSEIERVLDSDERERASRIVRSTVRRRRIAARGALRVLLGSYLGEHPSAVRLGSEGRHKPVLDLPGEVLHFNLSHSGSLAVYALTELCPIGVDVELLARRPNGRAPGREQLRAWVRYEAEAKRLGVGIAPGGPRPGEPSGWITEVDAGPGAVAAVALARAPDDLRCLDWPCQAP